MSASDGIRQTEKRKTRLDSELQCNNVRRPEGSWRVRQFLSRFRRADASSIILGFSLKTRFDRLTGSGAIAGGPIEFPICAPLMITMPNAPCCQGLPGNGRTTPIYANWRKLAQSYLETRAGNAQQKYFSENCERFIAGSRELLNSDCTETPEHLPSYPARKRRM